MTAEAPQNPIILIPARLAATRLPGKPLAEIAGAPMIVHVWRRAVAAEIGPVVVACGDRAIADAIEAAGGRAVMTDPVLPTGSDRIHQAITRLDPDCAHDAVINVQGDLPFIPPEDLDALAAPMRPDTSIVMATIGTPIVDEDEWRNPNVVKVVCDQRGDALYFSRSPIPYWRDQAGVPPNALRHIGVYGYRRDFLLEFASWPPSRLEQIEKLEQLRAMERGYRIRVVPSVAPSLEIDTPEDLARANAPKS